ncbi:MAG: ABC transporter ATP-binding protein [Sulfolobales archaeon]
MRIIVDGIEIWYKSIQALRNVSLEARSGEAVFIIGPNGSGKTTLLKTIASIVKPRRGAVYIDGKALERYSLRELSRITAYVDPHISSSIPSTVLEFLETARYPHQKTLDLKPSERDIEVIDRISREVNIRHLLNRKLNELSSGEFQRVLIARALVQEPRILLLDEPSAFLDIRYRMETLDLVRRMCRERDLIALIAIHDLYLASLYADKIIMLSEGLIVASGDPGDVLRRELIEKIYGVNVVELSFNGRRIVIPYKSS